MDTPQTKNPKNIAPKLSFTLPKPVSFIILAIAFLLWIFLTSFATKLRVILCSAAFSLIEFTFYSTTIELPNGDLIFKPFDPRCRKGHTVRNITIFSNSFRLLPNFLRMFCICQ